MKKISNSYPYLNTAKRFTFTLKEPSASVLSHANGSLWLGKRDGNITFDDSLDFDISEIESVYEDEGK